MVCKHTFKFHYLDKKITNRQALDLSIKANSGNNRTKTKVLKGALWSVSFKQTNLMFTFSVKHQNAFWVYFC